MNNEDAAAEALPDTEPGDQPRLRPRGSNQVGMRQFNERVVLQALRVHGSLAKADIARLTGLTAQTIGLITARLDEDQLLRREAPVRGRVGQPSVPLGLHPDGAFAIGIKIGRRSADWLLVDFTGQVRERLVLDYAFPDIPVLLPAIKTNLNRLLKKLGPLSDRVVGVGVAAPFQLGGWHRMLGLTAEQSQAWNQIDLGAEVQKLTELPVNFAKDTSAACVAELLQGRGRDIRSFLYLFMDTFVGGGLVLDSHLHRGIHGNAGAVASLPLRVAQGGELAPQLIGEASLWDLEQRFRQHGLDPMAAYDARALQSPWLPYSQEWMTTRRAGAGAVRGLGHGVSRCRGGGDGRRGGARPVARPVRGHARGAGGLQLEGLHRPRLELGSIGSDARALGGALLPLHTCFAPDHDVILKV